MHQPYCFSLFFFNDTATTEIYTLSLHDALPISKPRVESEEVDARVAICCPQTTNRLSRVASDSCVLTITLMRSEEHTSELQSPVHLVCRLLLEKKKKDKKKK